MSGTDKDLAQTFFADFQAARTDLTKRLDDLKASHTPATEGTNDLALDVAKLRKEYIDAREYLPTYDQRQYDNFLKSMEQSVEELRTASAGKPKFSFKRKANKGKEAIALTSSVHLEEKLSVSTDLASPKKETKEDSTSSHVSLSGFSSSYLSWSSIPPPNAAATDLAISDLKRCVVNLLPHGSDNPGRVISALHVRNLTDTVLLLPRIEGSALLHDMKNCMIILGCHQFRMHTSIDIRVHLAIQSNPIIEHCSSVTFASYPSSLQEGQPVTDSKHLSVQDFSHIRQTPSPNWCALPAELELSEEEWTTLKKARSDDVVAMLRRYLPESLSEGS
ncbi:tubulin binding cofactor C-domain-containing protein [Irpex rosettiformis]|uniref:Tubulin binding cofactor C-domain-containing protein n=1 Tax=Irpex rosettiformis TaxID=378272 RepID=A0ACB8U5D3_9APHY|nr:tubulin binding cofactor C-domain-containing protein [Irpex rosettiformis]